MNSIIQTPTNDLQSSLDFYSVLNFTTLSEHPVLVSDGKTVIEINPDRFARAGIKLFASDWSNIIANLALITKIHTIEGGYLLSDPSGVSIYLMEKISPFNSDLSKIAPSTLGNYAGLSLETTDIERSIKFYTILDFEQSMGSIAQGWIGLTNKDNVTISLMQPNSCPHLFFNPSMTFFNGKDNLKIIEKIKELNIPISEEITVFNPNGIVDNIIIRDPGGYGFFIFSD